MPGDDQPGEPGRQVLDHELGEELIARDLGGRQSRRPDRRAHEQEQRELEHDHDAGPDERHARVGQRPGGEQSLHDEVVGAVRRRRQERATQKPAEQGVGPGEIQLGGDELELAGLRRHAEGLGRPARDGPGDQQRADRRP